MRQISGLAAFVVLGGCAVAAMGRLPQSRLAADAGRAPQSGPATLQFEVVSVKPTQPGSRGGPGPFVQTEPGHLVAQHIVVHPGQSGGTRHLSAAQFVYDQRDAIAMVASQDGRFTIFAWSPCEDTVHAHRIEALLL